MARPQDVRYRHFTHVADQGKVFLRRCLRYRGAGDHRIRRTLRLGFDRASQRNGVRLSSNPLGVNVAPWQTAKLNPAARQRMESALKQLGSAIAVRYGGGVFADADNQMIGRNTNVVSQAGHQTSNFWGDDSDRDALTFPDYVPEARAVARQRHGDDQLRDRDTRACRGMACQHPRAARSGVRRRDRQRAVRLLLSRQGDHRRAGLGHLVRAQRAHDCPYQQYGGGSPGIRQFARSFIAHAPAFIRAVHEADPSVKVVLPYAISPPATAATCGTSDHGRPAGLPGHQRAVVPEPNARQPVIADRAVLAHADPRARRGDQGRSQRVRAARRSG